MTSFDPRSLRAALVSGSPSDASRSARLLARARGSLDERGVATTWIDLAALPADALLGRGSSEEVEGALDAVLEAGIVAVSTPVYRASYSGLLKVFFDLLPRDGLAGKVGIPIATGAVAGHLLVLDHALRPLFASVGATVVPTGTYGTDRDFEGGEPDPSLLSRVERAVDEALSLARGIAASGAGGEPAAAGGVGAGIGGAPGGIQ